MSKIVNQVKVRREKLGISQAELAKVLDVTIRTIQNIERQQPPSLATALRLAEYLSMPVDELFRFEDYYKLPKVPSYPPEMCILADYLIATYGDYGNPMDLEALALYPNCPEKDQLMLLLEGY